MPERPTRPTARDAFLDALAQSSPGSDCCFLDPKRDHGAIGDGVADDTTAMQATLADAATFSLPVLIPEGTYRVTDQLTVPEDIFVLGVKAAIRGEIDAAAQPRKAVIELLSGARISNLTIRPSVTGMPAHGRTGAALAIGDGQNLVRAVSIDGIRIDGAGSPENGNGIVIFGRCHDISIAEIDIAAAGRIGRGVLVHWSADEVVDPNRTFHPYNIDIRNVAVTDGSPHIDAGAVSISAAYNVRVATLSATNCRFAGYVYAGDRGADGAEPDQRPLVGGGIVFDGVAAIRCRSAFRIDGQPGLSGARLDLPVQIRAAHAVDGQPGAFVSLNGVNLANCRGVVVSRSTFASFTGHGIATGGGVRDLSLEDIHLVGNRTNGVYFSNGAEPPRGLALSGGSIWGNGHGNLGDTAVNGLFVGGGAEDVTISGTAFGNPDAPETAQKYGVRADGAARHLTLTAPVFHSHAPGGAAIAAGSAGNWGHAQGQRLALYNPRYGIGVTQRLIGAPQVRDRGDGRLESFHFAAPDGGTWSPGDICWNTAPDAAGIAGWLCVAAGSPGTWKTMTAA